MKKRYRLFRRGEVYYCQDNQTDHQESLRTKDKATALRILHAKNEAHVQPAINVQLARAYLTVGDPRIATRTWQEVIEKIIKLKRGETHARWLTAAKDHAFDGIRKVTLLETRADHVLRALELGTVATNVYLRRIHNFALAMSWLPVPVIPKRQWPPPRYKDKRAITLEEHRMIVSHEQNPERRAFYELAWYLGASQSDIAFLEADNIDWKQKVIAYSRKKTGQTAFVSFGEEVASILSPLPDKGPLFPYLRRVRPSDRATEFKKRCRRLGIQGVTLHSYRYAWAERARQVGFPERFAQEALGHNSKAVHRAYARKARVVVPALETFAAKSDKIFPIGSVLTP